MDLFLGLVFSLAVLALAWYSKACRPFFAALWLCIFCLLGDALALGLVLSPQGQDFLIALRGAGPESSAELQQFWLFSSLLILAFCAGPSCKNSASPANRYHATARAWRAA